MNWNSSFLGFKIASSMMFVMLSLSSSSASICVPPINPIVNHLKRQCPISIFPSWPIQIKEDSVVRFWKSNGQNAYIAMLYYASWCPFSMDIHPKFLALTSMYPQIHHVMIKHSFTFSFVFFAPWNARVPSIVLVNKTQRIRHHGPKDLNSLLNFYQQTTGLDPVLYLTEDEIIKSFKSRSRPTVGRSWNSKRSMKDMAANEPCLAFSLLFISLKTLSSSTIALLCVRYIPCLIPAIFRKLRHHLVDLKKAFIKPKLWNNRNLHKPKKWFPPFVAKSRGR